MTNLLREVMEIKSHTEKIRAERNGLTEDFARLDRDRLELKLSNYSEAALMAIEDRDKDAGMFARWAASAALELLDRQDADDQDDAEYWDRFNAGFDAGHAALEERA